MAVMDSKLPMPRRKLRTLANLGDHAIPNTQKTTRRKWREYEKENVSEIPLVH